MKSITSLLYAAIVLLTSVRTEEVTTPSSLLGPRNFNHHPFDAEQYLRSLNLPVPTKQGPVLFPNDSPPPPPPPLIVTSRPLLETIARSDRNPLANNSVAESRVAFVPYRAQDYKYGYLSSESGRDGVNGGTGYEGQTALPPIYKAISNHAKQNLVHIQQKPNYYQYQVKEPEYTHQRTNEIADDGSSEYDHTQNYAFSYAVKDKKTGDDFSHSQHSSGSATNGEYRVRLPDGRMQIVSYTADENGYKADVRYDDEEKTNDNIINNDYANANNYYNDKQNSQNHVNDYADSRNTYNDKINNNYDGLRTGFTSDTKINNDYNTNLNNYISKQNVHNDYKSNINDYTNINNNPQQRDFTYNNKELGKDDYYNNYPDSKEYYNEDYSSEFNTNYQPYKSKYSSFVNANKLPENNYKNFQIASSTVKPSYEELRDLFVTKKSYDQNPNYFAPSTTKYTNFDVTTENVVLIGAKSNLYTNIRNNIPVTPSPLSVSTPFIATTPRSYLVSTIASLRNRLSSPQPVLSDRFIDKINKYLTFK